eukprot:2483039-Pyramimonas_sp.AAC.1
MVSEALASRVGEVKVQSGAPISPCSPTAIELKGLRERAAVTKAVYPSRYQLALPPHAQAAPPELADDEWPW